MTVPANLTALAVGECFRAEPTSEDSEVEDLFELEEMARDWEGAALDVGGLGDSVVSPLGRTPSANHTLLCSRERDPKQNMHNEIPNAYRQKLQIIPMNNKKKANDA